MSQIQKHKYSDKQKEAKRHPKQHQNLEAQKLRKPIETRKETPSLPKDIKKRGKVESQNGAEKSSPKK
jgi:hypothetical protein